MNLHKKTYAGYNTYTLTWELISTVTWVNTNTLTWEFIGTVMWVYTNKPTLELNRYRRTGPDQTPFKSFHTLDINIFRELITCLAFMNMQIRSIVTIGGRITDAILKYFSSLVMSLRVALVGLGGVNLVF